MPSRRDTLSTGRPSGPLRRSELEDLLRAHIRRSLGKPWEQATPEDLFRVMAIHARELMAERMAATEERYAATEAKRLYYLSMEFLMGRALANNLHNLGLYDLCVDAVRSLGFSPEDLFESEPDAALGNGGLGRLAACFLDSLATLDMPGYGYGIHYEFGMFRQEIQNGYQREKPEYWQSLGSSWFIDRWEDLCLVPIYGHVEETIDRYGVYNPMWMDWKLIVGVPRDMPIVGHGGMTVNYLRLFSARAPNEFDMEIFNAGDYLAACEQQIATETITKVLYPSDAAASGRELRFIQEYFLAACAVRDIVRRFKLHHDHLDAFADHVAIQLNDTHPSLVVAELMRVLVDENNLNWDYAWDITTRAVGYTNHTLLPEALEKWPVSMFERVLPRHLQVIYEINRRFLDGVALRWPGDAGRLQRMSIIGEQGGKHVRMAHLAIAGSHAVNGVSEMHGALLRRKLAPDFAEYMPERFLSITNGVAPRRWLLNANPALSALITETLGTGWLRDLERLRELEPYAEDPGFRRAFREVKYANKTRLAGHFAQHLVVDVNPDALFDVHIKRMHEYKRQLLNALRIVHDYLAIAEDGFEPPVPRLYLFSGKAAPGYWVAKQVIKLIHCIAETVQADAKAREYMQVLFVPDYRVSLAELMIPAADLSEQISAAGTEASGTSNMKFMLNGALTMGTLDGANIEIRDAAGPENFFGFGLTREETEAFANGAHYDAAAYYQGDERIRRVFDALRGDRFCREAPGTLDWAPNVLLQGGDKYFHLADLGPYLDAQARVTEAYRDQEEWTRMAILNVARAGRFSSDRAVMEYAEKVWGLRRSGPA